MIEHNCSCSIEPVQFEGPLSHVKSTIISNKPMKKFLCILPLSHFPAACIAWRKHNGGIEKMQKDIKLGYLWPVDATHFTFFPCLYSSTIGFNKSSREPWHQFIGNDYTFTTQKKFKISGKETQKLIIASRCETFVINVSQQSIYSSIFSKLE